MRSLAGNTCWLVAGLVGGGFFSFFPGARRGLIQRVGRSEVGAQRIRRVVPMHVPCAVRVLR